MILPILELFLPILELLQNTAVIKTAVTDVVSVYTNRSAQAPLLAHFF